MNQIKWEKTILSQIINLNQSTSLIASLQVSATDVKKRMAYYFSIPQPAQKSQEWLNQRTNYITASALEDALSPKWSSRRNELLKNKVSRGKYRTFSGNEATRWGEKYEDVANAVYCHRQQTQVEEFGLLPHANPDLYFLGASTDGISQRLINLEIKCPFSRRIIPGKVPKHYWKQTQLQMEVLDLPVTHFLECKFREYPTGEDFWEDFDFPCVNPEKGIIIEYVSLTKQNNDGEQKTCYHYSPVDLSEADLRLWEENSIQQMVQPTGPQTTQIYIRSHYWVLEVCSIVNIARDQVWFQAQIPYLKEFWQDVEYYRSLVPDNPNLAFHKLCEDIQKHRSYPEGRESLKAFISNDLDAEEGRSIPNPCLIQSSDDEDDIPDNYQSSDKHKQSKNCLVISSDEEDLEDNCFPVTATHEQAREYLVGQKEEDSQDVRITSPKKSPILRLNAKNLISVQPAKKLTLNITRKSVSEPPLMLASSEGQDSCQSAPGCLLTSQQTHSNHSLVLSSSEDDDLSSSLDLDEGYSSGSGTDNDSPPMRPPPKTIYYRKKRTNRSIV